jgi:hypothetical protein
MRLHTALRTTLKAKQSEAGTHSANAKLLDHK